MSESDWSRVRAIPLFDYRNPHAPHAVIASVETYTSTTTARLVPRPDPAPHTPEKHP